MPNPGRGIFYAKRKMTIVFEDEWNGSIGHSALMKVTSLCSHTTRNVSRNIRSVENDDEGLVEENGYVNTTAAFYTSSRALR